VHDFSEEEKNGIFGKLNLYMYYLN